MTVLTEEWLPNHVFLTLSSVSCKLMAWLHSCSTSYLLCLSRATAFRLSTAWRWGLTQRACSFTVTNSFLLKCPGRKFNDSVPMGFPYSHDYDVHPLDVLFRAAVYAIGRRNPRPCVDCGKTHPYDQLKTPATAADYLPRRDKPLASVKALVIAVQRAMVFVCFLPATVVPPAWTYGPRPSYYMFKEQSPNAAAVPHSYTRCAPKLVCYPPAVCLVKVHR